MSLGNDVGFTFDMTKSGIDNLYVDDFGGIVLEVSSGADVDNRDIIGTTKYEPSISI